MKKKTPFILAILLPVQILAINILKHYPFFIEHYYSNGIYPVISKIERWGLGWIPFSFGDFLYTFFVIALIRWLYIRIKTRFRKPIQWFIRALATFSVIYACFNLFWGFNYYRLPLHKSLHIKADYTQTELEALTHQLIDRTNELQLQLTGNDTVKVNFPFKKNEIRKLAIKGYANLAKTNPKLTYEVPSVKTSLFSIPLSYMGFNGYLNPLTNEAQVNNRIPKFKLPSTTAHEIGHQIGFAKENEANFMACLNTMNHSNPYFRYAGYTFALKYCLGDLNADDHCQAENLVGMLNPGVLKNYREVDQFWRAHQNPLAPFFKLFYGGYLKANNQPLGIESYNYVVALLVNYFQGEQQLP